MATMHGNIDLGKPAVRRGKEDEGGNEAKTGGAKTGGAKTGSPSKLKDRKIPVRIGLANEVGHPHVGVIDFADNQVDPSTGTILIRGVFPNKERRLAPGLFVNVRVDYGKPVKSLLVSDRAVGTDQGQKYLLGVDDKNIVQYRSV